MSIEMHLKDFLRINYLNLIPRDALIASFIAEFESRESQQNFYSSLELACFSEDIGLMKELPEQIQNRLKYYLENY
jgi:hypothetical protein